MKLREPVPQWTVPTLSKGGTPTEVEGEIEAGGEAEGVTAQAPSQDLKISATFVEAGMAIQPGRAGSTPETRYPPHNAPCAQTTIVQSAWPKLPGCSPPKGRNLRIDNQAKGGKNTSNASLQGKSL